MMLTHACLRRMTYYTLNHCYLVHRPSIVTTTWRIWRFMSCGNTCPMLTNCTRPAVSHCRQNNCPLVPASSSYWCPLIEWTVNGHRAEYYWAQSGATHVAALIRHLGYNGSSVGRVESSLSWSRRNASGGHSLRHASPHLLDGRHSPWSLAGRILTDG